MELFIEINLIEANGYADDFKEAKLRLSADAVSVMGAKSGNLATIQFMNGEAQNQLECVVATVLVDESHNSRQPQLTVQKHCFPITNPGGSFLRARIQALAPNQLRTWDLVEVVPKSDLAVLPEAKAASTLRGAIIASGGKASIAGIPVALACHQLYGQQHSPQNPQTARCWGKVDASTRVIVRDEACHLLWPVSCGEEAHWRVCANEVADQILGDLPQTTMAEMALAIRLALSGASERISQFLGHSILFSGPPAVGKTTAVQALCSKMGVRAVQVNPGRLFGKYGVESDVALKKWIQSMVTICRPCVLILDQVDALCPSTSDGSKLQGSLGDVDRSLVQQLVLLTEKIQMDPDYSQICMVGVTSRMESLHPTAKRCFSEVIEVSLPSIKERQRILQRVFQHSECRVLMEVMEEDSEDSDVSSVIDAAALSSQGFTAGDLRFVCGKALKRTKRRSMLMATFLEEVGRRKGLVALRAGIPLVVSTLPKTRWSDVGGLKKAKASLLEMLVWPRQYPEAFRRLGLQPASGILLYGPPGTGKTLLARAAAYETQAYFIDLKISHVISCEIGETEKAIQRAFDDAVRNVPSIIFIDEFQALFSSRESEGEVGGKLASQLLQCMDALHRWKSVGDFGNHFGFVVIIAATNELNAVDKAFLRPGRFDRTVEAGLPNELERKEILQLQLDKMQVDEGITAEDLACQSSGFSAADLVNLSRRAKSNMVKRVSAESQDILSNTGKETVKQDDFTAALEEITNNLHTFL